MHSVKRSPRRLRGSHCCHALTTFHGCNSFGEASSCPKRQQRHLPNRRTAVRPSGFLACLLHNFYVNVIIENVLMYFLAFVLFVPRHLFGDAYSACMNGNCRRSGNWDLEFSHVLRKVQAMVLSLAWRVSIYFIWWARNGVVFQSIRLSADRVVSCIRQANTALLDRWSVLPDQSILFTSI